MAGFANHLGQSPAQTTAVYLQRGDQRATGEASQETGQVGPRELLFLYREVLGRPLEALGAIPRPRAPLRLRSSYRAERSSAC